MTNRKEGIGEGIILLEVQPLGLLKMVSSCTAGVGTWWAAQILELDGSLGSQELECDSSL